MARDGEALQETDMCMLDTGKDSQNLEETDKTRKD